jgi:hypothetical protein
METEPLRYQANHDAADEFARRALGSYILYRNSGSCGQQNDEFVIELYNAFESFKQRYEAKPPLPLHQANERTYHGPQV